MIVDEDRLICDHEVFTQTGALIQNLIVRFSSNSSHHEAESFYAGSLSLCENVIVFGYNEYARFSVFKWNQLKRKYMEMNRALLKKKGSTKHIGAKLMKKNRFVKHQFYCSMVKDICRV